MSRRAALGALPLEPDEHQSPRFGAARSVVQIRNSFIHVEAESHGGRLPRFPMPAKLSHLKTASAPDPATADSPSRKDDVSSVSSRCSTAVPSLACRDHRRQSSSATVVTIDEMESELGSASELEEPGAPGLREPRSALRRTPPSTSGGDSLQAICARVARAVDEESLSRSSLGTVERVSDLSGCSQERLSDGEVPRVSDAGVQTVRSVSVGTSTERPTVPSAQAPAQCRESLDPWALADLRRALPEPAAARETLDPWALADLRQAQAHMWHGLGSTPAAGPPAGLDSASGPAPPGATLPLPQPMAWPPGPMAMPQLFPQAPPGEDVAMLAAVHAGFSAGAAAAMQNVGQAFMFAAVAKHQQQLLQQQNLMQQQQQQQTGMFLQLRQQQRRQQPQQPEPAVASQATPTGGRSPRASLGNAPSISAVAAPPAATPGKRSKKPKPPPPCKWFARGSCKFSDTCRFPHVQLPEAPAPGAEHLPAATMEAQGPLEDAALERPSTPRWSEPPCLLRLDAALPPASECPSAPRESDTSLPSQEGDGQCQLIWCDQRAFKETPETLEMKATLQARTGLVVKSHKTAEKCIRLLQKKQHWREKPQAAQPQRIFLVSWLNAPVLVPYLSQSFGGTSRVVVLCDQCRTRGLDTAGGWAKQFGIVECVAASWDDAVQAATVAARTVTITAPLT